MEFYWSPFSALCRNKRTHGAQGRRRAFWALGGLAGSPQAWLFPVGWIECDECVIECAPLLAFALPSPEGAGP